MVYRVIGLMSGSSLDGLDIVFTELTESGGRWTYEILHADCYPYTADWAQRLRTATSLNALDYQLLHTDYGHYLGQQVNRFIEQYGLAYKTGLVASHGHTTFHVPGRKMTAQLGDGAAIAAETKLPVVTDLRALDVALGGQGAPIVPMGEKLLLGDYRYFLNIGGIANVSLNATPYLAFDICPANRVLNMLAAEAGRSYDANGEMAAAGKLHDALLADLNDLDFYKEPFPKSLANDFGTDVVYPLIKKHDLPLPDAMRTFAEHIAVQIANSVAQLKESHPFEGAQRLLATGGGAHNTFVISLLREKLAAINVQLEIPASQLVDYKEALIMALLGTLRWREEYTVMSTVTGAERSSIGGALWMGQEA